jgi:hyperosmotically inducible protein
VKLMDLNQPNDCPSQQNKKMKKMKLKFKSSLIVLTCLCVSASLYAQNNAYTNAPTADFRNDGQRASQFSGTAKASDLIGATVKNYQQETLGKVEDLAVDVEAGHVVQIILSSGGFLGMGGSYIAVPAGVFHYDANDKVLHLDASTEKIKAAPKFDSSKWDESNQSNQVMQVNNYYGQQSYFVADENESWTTNLDGSTNRTLPRNMDGTINTLGARTMDTAHNVAGTTNGSDVTTNNDYTEDQSFSKLGYVQKGSQLIGMPVKNLQEEKLGKIDNFIVALPSGRIVAVIISSGAFITMNDQLSAVPSTLFKLNDQHNTLQLNVSKDSLSNSPRFKSDQWPDFNQTNYTSSFYGAYNAKSYFKTNMNLAADNTGRNVRDRDNAGLTPLNQGNSQRDIDITAQIRKAVVADKNMSVNAMNVKIITTNGHVTLRGPVNAAEEKQRIGEIAGQVAQSANVDNELDVQVISNN